MAGSVLRPSSSEVDLLYTRKELLFTELRRYIEERGPIVLKVGCFGQDEFSDEFRVVV
jgi:hypothetical protein